MQSAGVMRPRPLHAAQINQAPALPEIRRERWTTRCPGILRTLKSSRRQDRHPVTGGASASPSLPVDAAGGAQDASPADSIASPTETRPYWKQLLTPFRDETCNNKLLALCGAGMLSSVATLIHDTYLPLYLQDVLGMSNTKIGNLQAIALFLSNFSKSASGTLGDLLSPARMVIIGTLLTTLNKPMFAMSSWVFAWGGTVATLYWITAAKVADRMSKGIREAPTKALMGELAVKSGDRPEQAFGLRQSAQTFGAMVGATIAATTFHLTGNNYIATFALSTLPAATALAVVYWAFSGTAKTAGAQKKAQRTAKKAAEDPSAAKLTFFQKARAFLGALKPSYWQALLVVFAMYFTRFDWSFVLLRAKQVMPKSQLPGLMMATMLVQTICAPPLSRIAKTSVRRRNQMLLLGLVPMVVANAVFALVPSVLGMVIGSLLVGLHMSATHGVTLGMMSSAIPSGSVPGLGRISGTAWSLTDLILGFALAYSNSFAGRLSDITVKKGMGNVGCFYGGGAAAALAALLICLFWKFGSLGQEAPKLST